MNLLIQYAAYFSQQITDIHHVLFVHNIKFDSTADAEEIISQLDKPLDELLTDIIQEKVSVLFSNNFFYEIAVSFYIMGFAVLIALLGF